MSIFDDKNLLSELIKIAQVGQPAPAAPKANLGAQQIKAIAAKLVANLQAQLNTPKFTSERANADLRMQAKDLNSLLAFLSLNGIAYNDLKIVYPNMGNQGGTLGSKEGNPELTKLTPEQQALYVTYPYENPRYFVYKAGLIAYLQDLKSKNIPLLTAMADKLIDQANDELGLKMGKEAPKEEVKIGPDVIIDELPSPLTHENANESGPAIISGKDLVHFSNPSAFINNIMSKLQYTKDNKVVDLRRIDKASICEVVNILMTRAEGYRAARPDDPRYDAYVKAVTQIATTYACPIGKAAPGRDKNIGYMDANGNLTDAGAAAIGTSLPLDPELIDFTRIFNFANKYVEVTKDNARAASVLTAVNQIAREYPAQRQGGQNLSRYTLDMLSTDIHNTTPDKKTSPYQYIEILKQMLFGTQSLLQALSARLRGSAGSRPVDELRTEIDEQMNFFSRNSSKLTEWTQDFNSQMADRQQQK